MLKRIAKALLLLLIVSVVGVIASFFLNAFVLDKFDAYGEVPIPGTDTLQLPAGDVTVSFHAEYPKGADFDNPIPIPRDLEVTFTPPRGVAEPKVTASPHDCDTDTDNGEGRCTVRVAHIPQTGDYTITTNGTVTSYGSPRLAFGHPSPFEFLTYLFAVLCPVSMVAFFAAAIPLWLGGGSVRGSTASSAMLKARLEAGDAVELEQPGQNWAAIDSLVQEFIREAIQRKKPKPGLFKRYWRVNDAQSKRDYLLIWKNGNWFFERKDGPFDSDGSVIVSVLAYSFEGRKGDLRRPKPVEGLQAGARRLLDS